MLFLNCTDKHRRKQKSDIGDRRKGSEFSDQTIIKIKKEKVLIKKILVHSTEKLFNFIIRLGGGAIKI